MGVARTRVRDRIVRRQEILLAAGRVFIQKGFRLATMEEIAAAAEVGVGTLYHYFRSKEHLFASLLAESTQILTERLREAAAKQLPPGMGILAINRAYVDYFAEYPDFFRIQMFFQHEGEAKGAFIKERKKAEKLARENLELLAEKIRLGQQAKMFRSDVEPMEAATALWASYNGIFFAATNPAMLELAGVDVERLLATAAFLHFRGLSTNEAIGPVLPARSSAHGGQVSLADLQEAVRSAHWVTPSMIFAGMPMAFQPARARGVREVYQYRVTGGRGGVWTIRIDDGVMELAEGATAEPTIVLEMSDENFIRTVTGQVEPAELWMKGEIKVTGDLQRAAMFRMFFLPATAEGQSS